MTKINAIANYKFENVFEKRSQKVFAKHVYRASALYSMNLYTTSKTLECKIGLANLHISNEANDSQQESFKTKKATWRSKPTSPEDV